MPRRVAVCVAVLWAIPLSGACGGGFVPPPRRPAEVPTTSELELVVESSVAHVYVRDEHTQTLVGLCTSGCTLPVSAGRYRIAGGLRHSRLMLHDRVVVVERGRRVKLRVDVGVRMSRRTYAWILQGVVAVGAVGLALEATDEVLETPRFAPYSGWMLGGSVVGLVGLMGLGVTILDRPTVDMAVIEVR